jgi:hypothetical protein
VGQADYLSSQHAYFSKGERVEAANLMLAPCHRWIGNAIGNEHGNVLSVNRIDTTQSVSKDGVASLLLYGVKSPVGEIAEIGSRPDDGKHDLCQAAGCANCVYRTLFGIAER